MKEVVFAFLIALVAGAFINGFGGFPPSTAPAATATEPAMVGSGSSAGSGVSETTDGAFDGEVLKSSTPVLVDFYSENCAPCRQMAPVIDQVAGDFGSKVKVLKLDVDSNPRVTATYNVSTIPTFIIFKNGERGEAFTGLVPRGILAQSLNKALQ